MLLAVSIILLVLCVLFYQVTLTIPYNLLSGFHIPFWLTVGMAGGIVAWLMADD
ncbi:MAG: hypothetical protein AAFX78_19940 [Cyanobacteria bacterium J06638_20]